MRCPVLLFALPMVVPESLNSAVAIAGGAGELQVSLPSIVVKPRPGVGFIEARGFGAGARRSEKRGRGAFSSPADAKTASMSPRRARSLPKAFIRGCAACPDVVAGRVLVRRLGALLPGPRPLCPVEERSSRRNSYD
jgi:hypothetical protein